ncbi:MAG: hypothetical protein IAI50_03165 [Candidatus Eremiobacteraeota bacterium]|nr:hypothetical protein [Candidatus Eremiobacteraeota bacterium]
MEDSAVAASSLYGSGSQYPPVSVPTINRVLDPGAAAWQTEPEFTLERWLLLHEKAPPLWNPYAAFGTPLAANMQSQPYSPFAWVRFALPSPRGYSVFIMLRLYVAGLCAFLFLRQFVGVLPALVGGTSYMYAGYFWLFVTMPELSTEVLLPGVLYAFERLLRRPGPGTAAVSACFLAAAVFGGMPESALLLLTLSYSYAIVRVVSDGALRLRLRDLTAYGGAATALALGLTALLTLPFFEYVGVSFNDHIGQSGGFQGFAERDPFGSSSLVQYLAPLLDGGPWNSVFFPDGVHYTGIRGFFGVGAFFFSLVAVFAQVQDALRGRLRKAPIFFFAIVALVALAKRWGWIGVNWIGLLPGLRQINFPKYEENLIAMSVAVLAGFGVAALCERRCSKPVVWAATAVPLAILAVTSYSDRAAVMALTAERWFYVDAMKGALVCVVFASLLAMFALRGFSARLTG